MSKRVCRDADDDWILATAATAKADVIVTGDFAPSAAEDRGELSSRQDQQDFKT